MVEEQLIRQPQCKVGEYLKPFIDLVASRVLIVINGPATTSPQWLFTSSGVWYKLSLIAML